MDLKKNESDHPSFEEKQKVTFYKNIKFYIGVQPCELIVEANTHLGICKFQYLF